MHASLAAAWYPYSLISHFSVAARLSQLEVRHKTEILPTHAGTLHSIIARVEIIDDSASSVVSVAIIIVIISIIATCIDVVAPMMIIIVIIF